MGGSIFETRGSRVSIYLAESIKPEEADYILDAVQSFRKGKGPANSRVLSLGSTPAV